MNPLAIIGKIVAAIMAFWTDLSESDKKRITTAIWVILEPLVRKYYRQKGKQ